MIAENGSLLLPSHVQMAPIYQRGLGLFSMAVRNQVIGEHREHPRSSEITYYSAFLQSLRSPDYGTSSLTQLPGKSRGRGRGRDRRRLFKI
jgi:hypothetical protein